MDNRKLDDEQYATLIDFLYRWGLKSPELLSEMADHYSEKALDRMDRGHSWEQVLKSFKTKETYLHLRKVQSGHEKLYGKRWWSLVLTEMKSVMLSLKHMLLVLIIVSVVYGMISNSVLTPFIQIVIVLKALMILIYYRYYSKYHKTMKHAAILQNDRYWTLACVNFGILHVFISHSIIRSGEAPVWESVLINQGSAWIWAVVVGLSLFLDVVLLRLIQQARKETQRIHPAVFQRLNQ